MPASCPTRLISTNRGTASSHCARSRSGSGTSAATRGLVCEWPLERQLPAVHAQPAVHGPRRHGDQRPCPLIAGVDSRRTTGRSAPVHPSPGATRFPAGVPSTGQQNRSAATAFPSHFGLRGAGVPVSRSRVSTPRRAPRGRGCVATLRSRTARRRCGLGRLFRTPVLRGDGPWSRSPLAHRQSPVPGVSGTPAGWLGALCVRIPDDPTTLSRKHSD